ncbi:uncharacterized protein LOC133528825 [Cydia pomonella]|uniref:uncharacterized protein LOC133524898 n=1 Tax=Cydia pomonella TaxID=82600 RepID=UPI002ADDE9F0|nr:uncharacterized protein LOC133524898 [Cydia pomonella]XP_061720870.1 uncharacterized protein LOC133527738 [Cydia pomonella]XP_061722290.1 uncharacterized protein LOC133528825 [Cydia pomonella]
MDDQFQLLFDKMKVEMQKQTEELTNTITEKIDEKLKPILEENKNLQKKVENLEKKVEYLEREKKANNIIIHGLKEEETSTLELVKQVKECFSKDLNIKIEDWDINKIYRIGNNNKTGKPKPTLLSLVSKWKKSEIMKNKKKLKEIYVTDDYSKETLEKRKALQPKLTEEREKGNIAFIKYDQLIIKNTINTKDKRKREISTSPQNDSQPRKQQTLMNASNNYRINAFDIMRGRSLSLSSNSATNEQ